MLCYYINIYIHNSQQRDPSALAGIIEICTIHLKQYIMKKTEKFFTQLYPVFGKNGYRKIYAIFKKHFKKDSSTSQKVLKNTLILVANGTYFAHCVVNHETMKRPEPDPTSPEIGRELERIFGDVGVECMLRKYQNLFWLILRDFFKVDTQGDVKGYQRFLHPHSRTSFSYGIADTKGRRVSVTPGGPTNRYNKHIFH